LVSTSSTPGQPAARLDVDRDAATVVADLDRAVVVQRHLDALAVAGQRLVHGVVDDLVRQVGQALGVGGPDVHARRLRTASRPSRTDRCLAV
jgi:hypothetical protein